MHLFVGVIHQQFWHYIKQRLGPVTELCYVQQVRRGVFACEQYAPAVLYSHMSSLSSMSRQLDFVCT
jgi:hypothetical protein